VIAAEMRKWLMTPAGCITLPDERAGNPAGGGDYAQASYLPALSAGG
jgi:hypothetical protein